MEPGERPWARAEPGRGTPWHTLEPSRAGCRRDHVVADEAGGDGIEDEVSEPELENGGFTDAELTALALAADPDVPLDQDAVPLTSNADQSAAGLPGWYMPPVTARRGKRWRTPVVLAIVVAFLVIEAVGLCSTYGQLVVG